MKILITGICGFVGYRIAQHWKAFAPNIQIVGMDNLIRPGSETNRSHLKKLGVEFFHGDIRNASDFEALPDVDWVLDCAANPSVLAGVDGKSSSRQLMEHNLSGSIELLEFCRQRNAGFVLLSTSRVYGVNPLSAIPVDSSVGRYVLKDDLSGIVGLSRSGISEQFSSDPPLSLYGTSKRAAELLALEYGSAFGFPVWINRCGVMAGPGQFGKADQGIISFWIHAHRTKQPLKYIGFAGTGHQVRDFFDPKDLITLLNKQISNTDDLAPKIINIGGGESCSLSLAELTAWCNDRFGKHEVVSSPDIRPFDIPWVVMDGRVGENYWDWQLQTKQEDILEDIALHAEANPHWLELAKS